ncbi:MAG: HAD family hydrolase [Actinobacteria bacterium]|nr:HAD family hydrolase [Actinomycetota bacterium]MCG2808309.1 HAD family hydrolase [Coriobacteriia bacterium]
MLKAVLFDLDGTLLDINIEAFLGTYFAALSGALAEVFDNDEDLRQAMRAVSDATGSMMRPHEERTNRQVFYAEFESQTGVDLASHSDLLERFYRDVFPTLNAGIAPASGGLESIAAARECGLRIAVATNPIFPRAAILHRMAWAGVFPDQVDVITDFDLMHATKPHPAYFRETAALLGVDPTDCLMVGDDRVLDLSAADVGMRTFHVSEDSDAAANYAGTMNDVPAMIRRLCSGDASPLD